MRDKEIDIRKKEIREKIQMYERRKLDAESSASETDRKTVTKYEKQTFCTQAVFRKKDILKKEIMKKKVVTLDLGNRKIEKNVNLKIICYNLGKRTKTDKMN